jgi:N-formylglutamate deformylase
MFSNANLADAWVVHIPHSSTVIPADARAKLLLSDQELALELLRMTDHLTNELVHSALSKAPRIRFSISRLVVDPERFPDDANETMSRVGMGVIYERTSHGLLLRHPPTPSERQNLLTTYYVPHHAALESAVATAVDLHGCCTILDVHSFPSRPLPYELDQAQDRPDICVGTDSFHTPQSLATQLVEGFSRDGFSVAVNRPFAGALTPLRYFCKDRRVKSIMVEVNRQLYLDEATGKQGKYFEHMQRSLAKVLNAIVEVSAS